MTTNHAALDALSPLSPDELYRQWVLAPKCHSGPPEWVVYSLHDWRLFAHPDAHVCEIITQNGHCVGWAIEVLAHLSEHGDYVPTKQITLPISQEADPRAFERALYGRDEAGFSDGSGLTGTWVAILFGGPDGSAFQRVYLGASHSVVYHPSLGMVAPTHNPIPDLHRNHELSRAFDCLATKSYFSFGLTAFEGLHRLLPNHYLDLQTFEPVRHWPSGAIEVSTEPKANAAAIVDYGQRLLKTIAGAYPSFRVLLSAGRDSRAVLAMTRGLARAGADILLSTSVGSDLPSRIDLQAARKLSLVAGLPHEVKQRRSPERTEESYIMRSFVRTGEANGELRLFSTPGIHDREPFDPTARFMLVGMGGETGRAYFWGNGLPKNDISPELLMKKVKAPALTSVLEAASEWLDGLPPDVRSSKANVLDLAYIEQRMGCWQAPMTYLPAGMENPNGLSRLSTSPMVEVYCYETMLRLPPKYRVAGTLQRDMVAYGWPELLDDIPFNNEPRGLRRLIERAKHHITRARVKLGALRRRVW